MANLKVVLALSLLTGASGELSAQQSSTGKELSTVYADQKSNTENGANPIRRIVTLLQQMEKKVETEGKAQQELFEKFMCYCKSSGAELGKAVADAETKIPQLESDIKEAEAQQAQLKADLKAAREDRDGAKEEIGKATEIREKDAAAFLKESTEDKSNLDALIKATKAIEKGLSGGFLQTNTAKILRKISLTADMSAPDRDMLSSFLTEGSHSPGSMQIVGILKQLGDTMDKELKELIATEEEAKKEFEGLVGAKEKEIAAAVNSIEVKTKRSGELAVEIIMMKEDLDDTREALGEDKVFLMDLSKDCGTKEKEWTEICKQRQMELVAIAETIKILNDDDALELFKKTVPSASLLQVRDSNKGGVRNALHELSKVTSRHFFGVDLIALALKGKKVNFDKVIKMIDDMVELLKKEQQDDDHKKEYCTAQFDYADDKKKALERSIADLEKAIEDAQGLIDTAAGEIKALEEGIIELDRNVASATLTRKAEHADYAAELAANNAAFGIIEFAKNRLNKFYNPKLYKPPPKRELTEEERISLNMGGTLAPTEAPGGIAGTGIGFFQTESEINTNTHGRNGNKNRNDDVAPPPPPPEAPSAFKKKGAESGGVIAMMDMIKADLEKEIQEMEFAEKDAQAEYESMIKDAAAKRSADSKSVAEKQYAKAQLEAEVIASTEKKDGDSSELSATKEYIGELHADCDWLLENFGTRKDARAAEVEALKSAKATLSGADFGL